MPSSSNAQNSTATPLVSERAFWLWFIVLLFAVFAFHAKTVPFSNEFVYLLRLQPNFLPNDWTFSTPAHEHWLFDLIFSVPARVFSLESIAWAGRIGFWILSLIALVKLGRLWEIAYWKIALATVLWLAFAQSAVNGEWIFGGFEAKAVAYACLLFSLAGFAKRSLIWPSILLGLSFSFHPAVGLWAIPAVGFALLFEKIAAIELGKVVIITFLFSMLGLIPLIGDQMATAAGSFDDWKFLVLYRMPWHLDAFQFSRTGTIVIFAMLAFNCLVFWKSSNFALRFLLKFQIALGLFFAMGLAFRIFEMFPLLRLMPMRLFPVITPLFFLYSAFYYIPRLANRQHKIVALLAVVLMIAALNPFGLGYLQVKETIQTWTAPPDDLEKTSRWIAANTPPDAIVIQPPHRRDLWYFSKRASIASFTYPTYDRLGEWRTRIGDLSRNWQVSKGETAAEELENAYNELSGEQILQIKGKYAATYLVSCAVYPYPIVFETETYKVYRLA
ncbi:MAG: hypothetical protein ACKVQJ_10290 [Pyrinomonadaceae bacterium]